MRYIDWILPLKIKNLLKHFFKKKDSILKETETKEIVNPILETNQGLNNSVGDNKICYILACGPSIKEMDLTKLIDKDCISVSNFFVHPLYQQIQPKYHVFAPTHEPITHEQYNSWIKDFQDKTSFKTTVLLNAYNKPITDKVAIHPEIDRVFYELSNMMPDSFDVICLHKPLPCVQTVVHIAIYIAISLGYTEINLLGVDHDWLFHFGKSLHFYNENESKLVTSNYDEYKNVDLEEEFKSHVKLWSIYKLIKKHCDSNNIKIYNCTPNSFLDVFEKRNIIN